MLAMPARTAACHSSCKAYINWEIRRKLKQRAVLRGLRPLAEVEENHCRKAEKAFNRRRSRIIRGRDEQ